MIIKRIIIAAAVLTSFALASCKKKDYVCKCSDPSSPSTPPVYHTIHDTKENAEIKCSEIPTGGFAGCKIL